ncbi:hypothetical protein [Dechloromonas sp. HYN0024]|uniref:hypothetical protein n=1 Tax=Dechloromonas sp. HYN0024 TaxID=2231055 RepID=UPI0013C34A24|nr:hypothetical protein [Dechloromonas sp. HYN0024]
MVLVQIDGNTSVEDLTAKIGNTRLVESALRELEEGGYIVPLADAPSAWEKAAQLVKSVPDKSPASIRPMSRFSGFGRQSSAAQEPKRNDSVTSNFSSFGKPILPASSKQGGETARPTPQLAEPEESTYQPGRSTGSKVLWALAVVFGLLVATMVFYPYAQFKPALEATASRMLNTPVRIDHVGVSFLPAPMLKLAGVHLGSAGDGEIAEIRVAAPLSLLGGAPHRVARIEVSGANLTANRLVSLPMLKGEKAGGQDLLVGKLVFDHFRLKLNDGLAFDDLFGDIAFRPDGVVEKATLETADRSLLVNALPSSQGLVLNIEGRAWTPAGTTVSFASLQAKGLLLKDKLLIQNIDTTFLGGILHGNWLLDWSAGLAMAGEGNFSGLDTRKVGAAFVPSLKIDGEISGTLRLRASGRDWAGLWANLEATLGTEITRGAFHGVDLGEAVRRSGVSDVRAGVTRFDKLRSTISVTPTQVVGRDVRMDGGMVTAVGQFTAGRNGEVESSMSVTMQTSVSSQNGAVRIVGVLPNLTATSRK